MPTRDCLEPHFCSLLCRFSLWFRNTGAGAPHAVCESKPRGTLAGPEFDVRAAEPGIEGPDRGRRVACGLKWTVELKAHGRNLKVNAYLSGPSSQVEYIAIEMREFHVLRSYAVPSERERGNGKVNVRREGRV